jgi:hypothetical protein
MAVPAVLGRASAARAVPSVTPTTAPALRARRRFGQPLSWLWLMLALVIVSVVSRVYTTNSLAGEPTSDEYLYAIHARDLARDWAAGRPVSLEDISAEGRSVAVESAALSFVVPWDPLTVGRTLQALFNALCVPMTFLLGRQIGLSRSAALAGALLLMAVPEFQELAWRFWTDSQATFIVLVYLTALVTFLRRPSLASAALGALALGLLLLTKESAAVTFTPFLVVAPVVALRRRLTGSWRLYAVVATALALGFVGGTLWLMARAPADLRNNALVQKTFGAGPLILTSVRHAIPQVPDYSEQLITLIGPRELGTGFLVAALVGLAWLLAQSVLALVTAPPGRRAWVVGWQLAAIVWCLAMVTPARDLASLGQSDPWVVVGAASLLVVIGTVDLHLRNARLDGWGLVLLGLVVLAVLAERLIISVTPQVSAAALTFRLLMPIVPLLALVAGGGLWAMAGALALLLPSRRSARGAVTLLASLALVVFWSPLLRERLSTQPLLGRVADRGADPDTPQGLRVETLVEAQGWLQANLQPGDIIMVGPGNLRHLAWYADLGVDGMRQLVDVGAHPEWTAEQRRQFELDRVGPTGVAYVVDFNVAWTDPDGEAARQWRQTFEALASRPNLETAYLKRDKFGNPVFYVLRNYGYATAPGH